MNDPPDPHAQELEALLQTLWKSNYTTLLERLGILRDAQGKLAASCLDDQTRKDAEAAAHKFAGVLGTFGLPEGSRLASKIEALLAQGAELSAEHGRELGEWLDELEAAVASKP
jgi:HPt (histidine-containing phosphotransfer) domain-containing protein